MTARTFCKECHLSLSLFPTEYEQEIDTHPRSQFLMEKSCRSLASKAKIAKETGIPMSKTGLERKIGSTILKAMFRKK